MASQDPADFFAYGGRADIVIKAASLTDAGPIVTNVDVQRGSSVTVPLVISHLSGANPIPSLTVTGKGVSNGYVPAAVVKQKTSEQRTQELIETGKISGELDLNSTLKFVPQQVILTPNQSTTVSLVITIPKDWPDYVVGEGVWYSVQFNIEESKNYALGEIRTNQVPIQVHVTG